jgi:hypothetical protein
MRIVIVAIFLCFRIYADRQLKVLRAEDEEERRIFLTTIHSTQLIIDGLLHIMRTNLNEIYKTKTLEVKTTQFLGESMAEAEHLEAKLVSITEINEEAIKNAVEKKWNDEKEV